MGVNQRNHSKRLAQRTSYSIPYVKGGTKLLLCKVLIGNSYRMSKIEMGKPRVMGYDSHISPCGAPLCLSRIHGVLIHSHRKGDCHIRARPDTTLLYHSLHSRRHDWARRRSLRSQTDILVLLSSLSLLYEPQHTPHTNNSLSFYPLLVSGVQYNTQSIFRSWVSTGTLSTICSANARPTAQCHL